jgi:hypothetical protein
MASGGKSEEELNDLVDQITVDAYGDDEQLWAFRQVIDDEVDLPTEAFVVGEPATALKIDYDGNERRGLTARCRRVDGSEESIGASDLVFPEGSKGADYMAAYRTRLGIEPYPQVPLSKKPKAAEHEIDLSKDIDLIVLALKGNGLSCRILGKEHVLTLRPSGFWETMSGEIVTVSPRRKWRCGGGPTSQARSRPLTRT